MKTINFLNSKTIYGLAKGTVADSFTMQAALSQCPCKVHSVTCYVAITAMDSTALIIKKMNVSALIYSANNALFSGGANIGSSVSSGSLRITPENPMNHTFFAAAGDTLMIDVLSFIETEDLVNGSEFDYSVDVVMTYEEVI